MSLLNAEQSIEIKRFDTITVFSTSTTDVANKIKSYAPFKKQYDLITQTFANLKVIIPKKDYEAAIAQTNIKTNLRSKINNEIDVIGDKAEAYAITNSNELLEEAMNFTITDVIRLKETEVYPFVKQIVDKLTPLLGDKVFEEYKITDTELATVLKDALDFDGEIGQNKVTTTENTLFNKQINEGITLLKAQLVVLLKLAKHFKNTDKDFYDSFLKIQKKPKAKVLPTGVQGIVTDEETGLPIANAIVKDLKSGKTATTDSKGHFIMVELRAGKHDFEVSATGKTTKTVTEQIDLHDIEDLNISL